MTYETQNLELADLRELSTSPQAVAERQKQAGEMWAIEYANKVDASAEIILRNPIVYLNDVNVNLLPMEHQENWSKVLEAAKTAVLLAGTGEVEGYSSASPLEQLQSLVFSNQIDPSYRGTVSDVMRVASNAFSDSVQHIPGNTGYYAGNVIRAESWLPKQ